MACACLHLTREALVQKYGGVASDFSIDNEALLPSGTTFFTIAWKPEGSKKRKTINIMLSYCPICGKKYDTKELSSRDKLKLIRAQVGDDLFLNVMEQLGYKLVDKEKFLKSSPTRYTLRNTVEDLLNIAIDIPDDEKQILSDLGYK